MRDVRLVAALETRHESVDDAHAELRHCPLHEAQRLHVFVITTLDDVTARTKYTNSIHVHDVIRRTHSATNLFAL